MWCVLRARVWAVEHEHGGSHSIIHATLQVIHKMYKDLDVDAKLLRSEGFADVRSWRFVPAGLDAGSGDASDAFQQACVYCCTDA